jgi:1-acyl-sn-glycerol-3-phosphate acyltransferase
MTGLRQQMRLAYRGLGLTLLAAGCLLLLEGEALVRRGQPRPLLVRKWVRRFGRCVLRLFGVRLHAHGPYADQGTCYPAAADNGVGRVFVMNHRSGVDIAVLFAVVDAHMVSRHDLAGFPLIGLGARRIGTLFVDRSSRRSGADVQMEVGAALERGEAVVLFPEGTVYADDVVRPFRPGAFKAALRAGAEIVPLGIAYVAGDEATFHSPSLIGHMVQIAKLPGLEAAVEIGTAIPADDRDPVDLRDAAHAQVQQLVDRARRRLPGPAPQPSAESTGLATPD